MSKKVEKKKEESKSSRWIKGTLTRPKGDMQYKGSDEEREEILNKLLNSSNSYTWSMIALEPHQDNTLHWHFIVRYRTPVKQGTLDFLRSYFDIKSKTNEIKFGVGHCKSWVGYIGKESNYTMDGEVDVNVVSFVEQYKKKQVVVELSQKEGITIAPTTVKEQEVIHWLVDYMTKMGYKVNWYTRQLVGIDKNSFYEQLNDIGFADLFGIKGLKLARSLISEDIYYVLPMWKPDLNWVSFSDGYWNIDDGIYYTLDDMKTYFPHINPVRSYNFEFDDSEPVLFIALLVRLGWDIEEFRHAYGLQFKTKSRRDKCLLLYGLPFSGKSTLVIPYLDVFKDVIGEWADDGGFSYSSIASHSKVYSEEVNVFDTKHDINKMKKLTEGVEFKTNVKHGVPVTCTPKTMMIVSNDSPPTDDISPHVEALRDRLYMFHAVTRISGGIVDTNMISKIRDEAAKILVWATA
jgi:hypothetical protein